MTVAELLSNEIFDLPIGWVDYPITWHTRETAPCRSYHQYIIRRLADYERLLEQLTDIDVEGATGHAIRNPPVSHAQEVRNAVRVLCCGIRETLKCYAQGSPSKAYARLSEALEPQNGAGLFQPPAFYFYTEQAPATRVYYRLRNSADAVTEPREMFHLPFEMRWRTRGYRFSIAGYPSLYAGTSPLLSLRELRQDEWNENIYAVKLRAIPRESPELPVRDVRYFNLRNQIEEFRRRYAKPGTHDGQILGFLIRWPLIMATSVPVGHTDAQGAGFHEEYVLPQLLLEWVNNVRGKEHKITGISFSSSRVEAKELTRAGHYNIVVPAEEPAATGLCSVRIRQFELTNPLPVRRILAGGKAQSAEQVAGQLEAALATEPYHRLHIG